MSGDKSDSSPAGPTIDARQAMKGAGTRAKRSSLNRKMLRLMAALSIVSALCITGLFYSIEMRHIQEQADLVLTDVLKTDLSKVGVDQDTNQILPDTYYVSTTEDGDSSLLDVEQDLIAYYLANRSTLSDETIGHMSKGSEEVYFYPVPISAYNSDDAAADVSAVPVASGDRVLIYTDVSFSTDLVKTSTLILLFVVLVISALMLLVEHRTVRVLDQKDEDMKAFFANASHELKTPLMAIRGYADGISNGVVDTSEACEVIDRETDRMASLIGGILEVSKIDSGIVQAHIEDNDVREILYDAIRVIEPLAKQRSVTIGFDLDEPLVYPCDEEMMFSVFSNILTNSIRYAKSSIAITATRRPALEQASWSGVFRSHRVSAEQAGNPGLSVRIENDGEPLSEDDARHVFDRFYTGSRGQTGIGMALSKEYLSLQHGRIDARVEDGRTVFEVVL